MDVFQQASTIEARGVVELERFLKATSYEGQYVLIPKDNRFLGVQKSIGDALVNVSAERSDAVEFKVEEQNKYGNFFLETWSNLKWFNRGWLDHLSADWLFYYFLNEKDLYTMSLPGLKRWAFISDSSERCVNGQGRIYDFHERRQDKREQMNDTWGRCVPIDVIRSEVGFKHWSLKDPDKPELIGDYTKATP